MTTELPSTASASEKGGVRDRFARTREDHASETAQDYVELIDELHREHGEARLVDIAARLGVTHVTAGRTIARLQREGLVTARKYRAIFLTDAGRALAEQSRRRHEVVLRFLLAIGVPEGAAHLDAEGIEHHTSAETLAAMERFLAARTPGEA
ncbi:MAG: manganese-binding transcriptional regulator MntR [Phycisphaerales bacterium]|nr:manganese-binding transcriptional regulator MntR [Phycisphaerales bacterium]